MPDENDVLATESRFFNALVSADPLALTEVLSDDFILVDVMTGSEIPREAIIGLVATGQLKFLSIDPAEQRVRRYGDAAVVTGRTTMNGAFEGAEFTTKSRYTHVFAVVEGKWQMVSAQGTPIADESTVS